MRASAASCRGIEGKKQLTDDFERLDEYELLGVAPGVALDALKRAYHGQISQFHPDRFATADPEAQAYAARRTTRINAAYRLLRTDPDAVRLRRPVDAPIVAQTATQTTSTSPASYNDQQAGLYDQALAAADAGNYERAIELLNQLIGLNPFYRDAVTRLAEFEQRLDPAQQQTAPASRQWLVPAATVLAIVLLVTVWLNQAGPTEIPAAPVLPTGTTAPDTESLSPGPTATAPVSPALNASQAALGPPVASEGALAESGALILSDAFDPADWPDAAGNGWQSAAVDGTFVITAEAAAGPIFRYRSLGSTTDMQVGVDVTTSGGQAGLLLRYSAVTRSYLAFTVDLERGTWQLDRRDNVSAQTLIDGALAPRDSARLVARLTAGRIELRIDGVRVALLRVDEPVPSNFYGVIASAGDGLSVSAVFRDLVVRAAE